MHDNGITRRHRLAATVAATLAAAGGLTASAGIIGLGTYQFPGNPGSQTDTPNTNGTAVANLTYEAFSRGTGVQAATANGAYSGTHWTSSFSATDYFQFSLTAAAGYYVTIASLDFATSKGNQGPTQTRVSMDTSTAFSSPLQTSGNFAIGATNWNMTDYTLAGGQTLYFRVYGFGSGNVGNPNDTLSIDNVSLTGTTVARASLAAGVGSSPAARVMLNATNVRYGVTITNNALAAGNDPTEALSYSMALAGATGLTLGSPSSGSGLGGGDSTTLYVDVDTTTAGAKGGGSVDVTGANAWRANGVTGATTATLGLGTLAVVAKRSVVSPATCDFGAVLVGAPLSHNVSYSSSGLANDTTQVQVAAAGATVGGMALNGTGKSFLGAASPESVTLTLSGAFAASGAKAHSFHLPVTTLENGGAGLSGEGAYSDVLVGYTASVYQAASLSAASTGGSLTITNAPPDDGGQRAAARVIGRSIPAGWTVAGFSVGDVLSPSAAGVSAAVSFAGAGLLNGPYQASGSFSLEHDNQLMAGAAPGDLGVLPVSLQAQVSANRSSGATAFSSGQSLAGYSMTGDGVNGTRAEFLDGPTSGARTVGLTLLESSLATVADEVTVTGTGADWYVLQVRYDPAHLPANVADESELLLGRHDTSYEFVGPGPRLAMSYAAYKASLGAGVPAVGTFGVDTANNTVWAVLDAPGTYAVMPEPASLALLLGSGLMLLRRRKS